MKKQSKSNKSLIIGLILALCGYSFWPKPPSEDSIRAKVVQLDGNGAACSGEQVKGPSGTSYILSAGHCSVTTKDGAVDVTTEDGRTLSRRVIAYDPNSDLMLIEGVPGLGAFTPAPYTYRFQEVRTFTHGRKRPTYKTEGTLVGEDEIDIFTGFIETPEAEAKCQDPKYKIDEDLMGKACMLDVIEMLTTAAVAPGSSGGPVVNSSGELIGVVSASRSDEAYGYLVTLRDIKAFLKSY